MTKADSPPGRAYTDLVLGDIRAEMARYTVSQSELGRRTHHNPDWVSDRLGRNPRVLLTTDDIGEIAAALGVSPSNLGRGIDARA